MKNMKNKNTDSKEKTTGRYVYDAEQGKVIKVSDEIPALKKAIENTSCPQPHHCCNGCCHH